MNSSNSLVITADDFGLSRHVTDTILETVDSGSVSNVSILSNGDSFNYALSEFFKRKAVLSLSIHINLTEGAPVTDQSLVPLLLDKNGVFKYSVFGLWIAFIFSFHRNKFREQIRLEISSQIEKVIDAVDKKGRIVSINGHQHVHMLPFVFEELARERKDLLIRIPKELFSVPHIKSLLRILWRVPAWLILSQRTSQFSFNDYFIGVLHSGHMFFEETQAALQRVSGLKKKSVIEIVFHPGSATEKELSSWKASASGIAWHYASERAQERKFLKDAKFQEIVENFLNNTLGKSSFPEIVRFFIAGGIATGTNLFLFFLFTDVFKFWYIGSAIVGYTITIGVSFTLQKFWAFQHYSTKSIRTETVWYVLNTIFGLGFDILGLYVLVDFIGVWYLLAQVILLALIATWNFFIYRFVIFKVHKK